MFDLDCEASREAEEVVIRLSLGVPAVSCVVWGVEGEAGAE